MNENRNVGFIETICTTVMSLARLHMPLSANYKLEALAQVKLVFDEYEVRGLITAATRHVRPAAVKSNKKSLTVLQTGRSKSCNVEIFFPYLSIKHVVTLHQNRLAEAVQVSGNNNFFVER